MKALAYISQVEWVCPEVKCGETNYTNTEDIEEADAICSACNKKSTLKLEV